MTDKNNNSGAIIIGIAIIVAIMFLGLAKSINYAYVDAEQFENITVTVTGDRDGYLRTMNQDQYTQIVDLRLTQLISDVNLTRNYTIGDFDINLTSNVAPSVGDYLCLKENVEFSQTEILAVTSLGNNTYQVTLDTPLDYNFTTGGGCSIRSDNWAVDGSTTPQTFDISPSGLNESLQWDITRIIMGCVGDGVGVGNDAPDMGDFFVTSALTNGLYLREVDGFTHNIFNVKDNLHIGLETYDIQFFPATRNGKYGVITRRSFNGQDKNGVVVRLSANTSDTFELVVQDDLTEMDFCHATAQGHVVEP